MNTISLIGSDSLLGREVRDIVSTAAATFDLRLVADTGEQPGSLTRVGDEPTVVGSLDAASLSGARAIFLSGSAESSRKALELLDHSAGATVIDLTGAAEERPEARLRAPLIEDPGAETPIEAAVHVIAHPASIALALFLRRLHAQEPLQNQTISLLSFKPMPHAIFDTQLTFSLLAKYGDEAPVPLEDAELRIERHLATLLALPGEGHDAPMPSLRLLQAPVFHGYSFSAWVEFESNPGVDTLETSLATDSIEVRSIDVSPPTNVGQAGQGGIAVGAIQPDRNNPEACWFWIVADNLRLTAENGVAVARQLV
jgi:aspartate-semialdehyde dehydrogenase